jgi:hypothetical protein
VTHAAAGRAAGVSERTVRRRLEDEDFRADVTRARAALVDRAAGRGAEALVDAVETLRVLMGSAQSEAVRVAACRELLRFRGEGHEDCVRDALLDVGSMSFRDVRDMFRKVVEIGLEYVPVEKQYDFLVRIQKMAAGR